MNQTTQPGLHAFNSSSEHPFIILLADLAIADSPLVGGKNTSLGGMVRELAGQGAEVPGGFAITAEAYRHFIGEAGSEEVTRATPADLDTHDMANLSQRGRAVRETIRNAILPSEPRELIADAYRQLRGSGIAPLDVAVRSPATAADLPAASFRGRPSCAGRNGKAWIAARRKRAKALCVVRTDPKI